MKSSLDEFVKNCGDHRPDTIAVVFTDITQSRSNMFEATYKDDYFDKEEIFTELRKYRSNLDFLKMFDNNQYRKSILIASYHRRLYNLKYNPDWMEFLCEFNYKGMKSDR